MAGPCFAFLAWRILFGRRLSALQRVIKLTPRYGRLKRFRNRRDTNLALSFAVEISGAWKFLYFQHLQAFSLFFLLNVLIRQLEAGYCHFFPYAGNYGKETCVRRKKMIGTYVLLRCVSAHINYLRFAAFKFVFPRDNVPSEIIIRGTISAAGFEILSVYFLQFARSIVRKNYSNRKDTRRRKVVRRKTISRRR